jgi:DNA modification methylase
MVARQGRPRREANIPKSVRLGWPGRAWEPGEAAEARKDHAGQAAAAGAAHGALSVPPAPFAPAAPTAVTIETVRGSDDDAAGDAASPPVRLVHGDALDVARMLAAEGLAGKVDVVYLDPPFASESAYHYEARLDGRADGRVVRSQAYDDRWEKDGIGAYLEMLAPRLEGAVQLLSRKGTIWVHVDYRASYLVRVILDEIMGRDAFVNEIVWRRAPNLGRQAASFQFGRTLDTIVVYGGPEAELVPPTRFEPIEPKAIRYDDQRRAFIAAPRGDYTDASIRKLDLEGRVHRTASGKVYVKYFLVPNEEGALCRERRVDSLWTDVPPLRHARPGERTGFPTQKPRALLDRILTCASPRGGLVVDLFAGSGTTAESAHALGRRCVTSDGSSVSLATARARLLRAGAPLSLERCGIAEPARATPPEVLATRRVELVAPSEPLAWAIDSTGAASADGRSPFCTSWHSERSLGAKTRPVLREAVFPHPAGPVHVAVWHDDGSLGTCFAEPQ